MHLVSLELENWGPHSSLELDLTSGLQIEGRNGSGKSSVLEAVRFIFSESALGYKTRVKNGERSARVKLVFNSQGNSYVIEKTLFVEKSSTAKMYCNETLVGDNPSSVYSNMQNIMNENVLDKLHYIPQGGLTSIVESLSRKEGRKELDSLFGLEKFDRVYRDSVEDVKEAKVKLEFINEELAKHPEGSGDEYEREIQKLGEEKKTLQSEVEKLIKEAEELESKLNQALEKVIKLEETKRQRDTLTEGLKNIEVEIARYNAELNAVSQRMESIGDAESKLKNLEEKETGIEKYSKIKEVLVKLEKINEKRKNLRSDDEREKLTALRKDLELKKEVEEAYKSLENSVRDSDSIKVGVKHDLDKQEKYMRELEDLSENANCPRCGQQLTKEHLEKEKSITREKLSRLKGKLEEVNTKLEGKKNSIKEAKEKLTRLEKTTTEAEYIEKEIERKEKESRDLEGELSELNERLKAEGYQGEDLTLVESKVEEHGRIKAQLEQARKEAGEKKELKEKQVNLSEKIEEVNRRRHESNSKLGELEYDEENYRLLRQNKDEYTEKKYSLENECDKKNYRVNEIDSRIKENEGKVEVIKKLSENKISEEKKLNLLTQAREVFHTDKGIQKYLRDRYVNQLNNLLTHYFKKLNQNPRYREVVFDKDYEVEVKSTQGSIGINQLSGGEKIQLAIALRIALTEMLSDTRLLILDEPFGSLDRSHREILGETLSRIAANGQLIVVTHVHVDSLQLNTIELEAY